FDPIVSNYVGTDPSFIPGYVYSRREYRPLNEVRSGICNQRRCGRPLFRRQDCEQSTRWCENQTTVRTVAENRLSFSGLNVLRLKRFQTPNAGQTGRLLGDSGSEGQSQSKQELRSNPCGRVIQTISGHVRLGTTASYTRVASTTNSVVS